jgi:hypothetical protein
MNKSTYPKGSQAWLVGEEAKLAKLVETLIAQERWIDRKEQDGMDVSEYVDKWVETLKRYCDQCDVITQAGGRV